VGGGAVRGALRLRATPRATATALASALTLAQSSRAQASDPALLLEAIGGYAGFRCQAATRAIDGCRTDLFCSQHDRCVSLWDTTLRALAVSQAAYEDTSLDARREAVERVGLTLTAYTGDGEGRFDVEAVVAEDPGVIVVGIAGTESVMDAVADLRARLVDPADLYDGGWLGCTKGASCTHIQVHSGFIRCAHEIYWSFVRPKLREALQRSSRPVQVVGHSLGGAVAQLLAAQVETDMGVEVDEVVTFGSPRVGDASWQHAYEDLLDRATHRWIAEDDPVPHLPSRQVWNGAGQQHRFTDTLDPRTWAPIYSYRLDVGSFDWSSDTGDHSLDDSYAAGFDELVPCDHPWRSRACR
jgi:Lipase (class 3)